MYFKENKFVQQQVILSESQILSCRKIEVDDESTQMEVKTFNNR